jgi:murein DD-endopeptidase MepM/ murein hydrolase activator NlpD
VRKALVVLGRFSFASLGLYGIGLFAVMAWQQLSLPALPSPQPVVATQERTAPVDLAPTSPDADELWLALPDRIGRGETLAELLYRNGFSAIQVHKVSEALAPHMNLRHLRPGDEIEIRYADTGSLESVRVNRGLLETYEARPEGDGWVAGQLSIVIEHQEVARHGVLEGSLFASMETLGETAALVIAFAEVFAWDFDFYTQSRQGDRFSVLAEKLYRDDVFVGYGDLLAAKYVSGDTSLSAFLFTDGTGKKGFYDPDGKSMKKAFLKTPLKFQRISSRFSYSRLHPVTGTRRPHLGVDYAAPTGTPVHTVAAGTVTGISSSRGNGRMVSIRHAMGYESKYLHLSRYAKGLRVGHRVQQKQLIGYVGATGLVTGPHLDFRLIRYGKPVNPLTQIFPPGPPVAAEYMEAFKQRVGELVTRLGPAEERRLASRRSPRRLSE